MKSSDDYGNLIELMGLKLEKIICYPLKYAPQLCLLSGIYTKSHQKCLVLNDKIVSFVTSDTSFFMQNLYQEGGGKWTNSVFISNAIDLN